MNTTLLHKENRCLEVRTNLSYQFEDWFYKEFRIESKTSHNCESLYKLMNFRVNTAHFLKIEKFYKNILKKTKNSRSVRVSFVRRLYFLLFGE